MNNERLLQNIMNEVSNEIKLCQKNESLENEIYDLLESYINDNHIDDFRILFINKNIIKCTRFKKEVLKVSLSITISADPNNFIEREILIVEDNNENISM